MKIKEIRDKQTPAIELEMKDLQKHLFDLRTQAVTEKLENPSLLRKTRKDIAQMKTILRERQLEEARAGSAKTEISETKEAKPAKAKKPAKVKKPAKAAKKA